MRNRNFLLIMLAYSLLLIGITISIYRSINSHNEPLLQISQVEILESFNNWEFTSGVALSLMALSKDKFTNSSITGFNQISEMHKKVKESGNSLALNSPEMGILCGYYREFFNPLTKFIIKTETPYVLEFVKEFESIPNLVLEN